MVRAVASGAVLLTVSALTTACFENSPQGEFAISVDAGQLLVVNCGADIEAPFEVYFSELAWPDSWTILDAASYTGWAVGEIRSADPAEWDVVDEDYPVQLKPGYLIDVFFQNDDDSARASFTVPDEGMEADDWLNYDDTISSRPCA